MMAGDHRPALNVLRGFAALAIVIYHFRYYSPVPWFQVFPSLRFGYLGVDFFFVLSGLVISHVYLDAFLNARESYARFLFLRVSRIFPVHALIMAVMLFVTIGTGGQIDSESAFDWITLTLLVRQWLLPDGYVWNSPAWSVSAEMFAYAFIFPLAVVLARRQDREVAGRRLMILGVGTLALLFVVAGTLNAGEGAGPLLRVSGGFLVGAGLYCLLSKRTRGQGWDWLILGGCAMIPLGLVIGSDVVVLASLTAVMVGAYMSTGRLAALMSARPLHYFGEVSFSLYLCHIPVLRVGKEAADIAGIERGVLFCAVMTVLAIATAALLYRGVEVPARAAMRRWWETRIAISQAVA